MKTPLILGPALAALMVVSLPAQTRIVAPNNKYQPSEDVRLGKQAAEEARQQLPIMKDEAVTSYVQAVGRRLVDAIPENMRHPEFQYTFEAVNVREINAFALPGGPMFVNRGMIEAAASEGEVAGVMAHEISHVVLRHGTAQASKATKYEVGTMAGAVIGAILGGQVGSVIAQGTQFGLGTAFLRFGREYEKQADIEGAQIMAAAGYDPREMANMFKTIEKQSSGGPEWLSDHPNPGNRVEYITKEAASLRVENPIRNSEGFTRVRAHLSTLPKAPTTEEATKNAKRGRGGPAGTSGGTISTGRVEPPSTRYTNYTEGNAFQISVPSNWKELSSSDTVTFAPEGAYGSHQGNSVFTHGLQAGLQRNNTHDLQTETDELIDSLSKGNPRLSQSSGYQSFTLDGRRALQTTLGNISEVTGREETIQLVTTQMRNGTLFWVVAVAPREELGTYQSAFQRALSSIRFRD
jgi:Zn-dependent protease with chaperone function